MLYCIFICVILVGYNFGKALAGANVFRYNGADSRGYCHRSYLKALGMINGDVASRRWHGSGLKELLDSITTDFLGRNGG